MACVRITAAITRAEIGGRPIKAVLDPYNPAGSTAQVSFNTTRTSRYETDSRRCHVNWVVLDSDWEAEFCRVAESHAHVKAYVKNHNLGVFMSNSRCKHNLGLFRGALPLRLRTTDLYPRLYSPR